MAVTSKINHHLTTEQMTKNLHKNTGIKISRQTVSRCLNGIGLYARKPVKRTPLTSASKDIEVVFNTRIAFTAKEKVSLNRLK